MTSVEGFDNERVGILDLGLVGQVKDGAFENNNIKTLSVPSQTNFIGVRAFKNNKLTGVTFSTSTAIKIEEGAFQGNFINSVYLKSGSTISANAFDSGTTINLI